jgi:hypothetical protein
MAESAVAPVQPAPTPVAAPPQPDLIAGKFADDTAFQKGFGELLSSRGVPLPEKTVLYGEGGTFASRDAAVAFYNHVQGNPAAKPAETPAAPQYGDDADYGTILKTAGVDLQAVSEKFAKDGKLSDADYAAIKKAIPGATKKVIDDQFSTAHEAFKLRNEAHVKFQTEVKTRFDSIMGGDTQAATVMEFVKTLPEKVVADLDRRLKDPDLWEGAALEMRSMYDRKTGADKIAPLVSGGMVTAPRPISSPEELIDVMRRRRKGDQEAEARFRATPQSVLEKLQ